MVEGKGGEVRRVDPETGCLCSLEELAEADRAMADAYDQIEPAGEPTIVGGTPYHPEGDDGWEDGDGGLTDAEMIASDFAYDAWREQRGRR